MSSLNQALEKLEKSKFRRSFYLNKTDMEYIKEKGLDLIRLHAKDFVKTRLAPAYIPNDGRQTPMKGHPVFKAQHGTACCCRKCLKKWYRVKEGVVLTEEQQEKIVNLIMAWIEKQISLNGGNQLINWKIEPCEKTMSIVIFNGVTAKFYENQLKEIF